MASTFAYCDGCMPDSQHHAIVTDSTAKGWTGTQGHTYGRTYGQDVRVVCIGLEENSWYTSPSMYWEQSAAGPKSLRQLQSLQHTTQNVEL